MPKLIRFLRQRERCLERTWNPLAPNFLVYTVNGTVYTRTYTLIPYIVNAPLDQGDPVPFGFRFDPLASPPLIAIQGAVTFDSVPVQLEAALGAAPPALEAVLYGSQNAPLTPSQQAQAQAQSGQASVKSLRPVPIGPIKCGISSVPLYSSSIVFTRLTILADPANTGIIWISTTLNTPAGQGFKLIAGAAKDIGPSTDPSKLVDASGIYIIGTNANDQVFLFGEI